MEVCAAGWTREGSRAQRLAERLLDDQNEIPPASPREKRTGWLFSGNVDLDLCLWVRRRHENDQANQREDSTDPGLRRTDPQGRPPAGRRPFSRHRQLIRVRPDESQGEQWLDRCA